MSQTVVSVENLAKAYRIGMPSSGTETFREMLMSAAAAPFRRLRQLNGDPSGEERIWALKDVSFKVQQGEIVGIIGRNGAGKSTLLKILSRITSPTSGRIEIRGRVSSLLEVGTGFHPELTGRENVYLNGALLGMSRTEINRKFDEIVDFSGVERFLDTPVKRFSSGMSVRLAFAVAAHLEPDVLIIDEVLAVGDAEFQKKSMGKMSEVAGAGRTVLVVSHNHHLIQGLCQRSLLLSEGSIAFSGSTQEALSTYNRGSQNVAAEIDFRKMPRHMTSSDDLSLLSFAFEDPLPALNRQLFAGRLSLQVNRPLSDVVPGLGLNALSGQRLLSCDSDFHDATGFDFPEPGRYEIEVRIPALPLTPSTYSLDVGCRTLSGTMLDEVKGFAQIEVIASQLTRQHELGSFPTVCYPSHWSRVETPRAETMTDHFSDAAE